MTLRVWPGRPYPLGATFDGAGVNFALFSEHATKVELCLFDSAESQKEAHRIAVTEHTDQVWHAYLPDAVPGQLYGYRVHGPYDPAAGHRFNPNKLILDPYAKAIGRELTWDDSLWGYKIGDPKADLSFDKRDSAAFAPLASVVDTAFTWGDDRPPRTPWHESLIYEVHVKGFTQLHPDVPKEKRGTYAGLASDAAIQHLRSLEVTAVELLPVHYFLDDRHLVEKGLKNYWGYNTLGFFAPSARYAAQQSPEKCVQEFKMMVRALHAAGIEVILDVVYNHTAEGNQLGPTLSFRGIDNKTYYMLAPDGRYMNFSGTGNTMNCNNPVVRAMVIDCLRYWVYEYHIDGFRFDLASILGRDQYGMPLANPPLIEHLAYDPVLARCKLIAEAWDAGGLYQVGSFPSYGRWAEWNGKYRDALRRFNKGDPGMVWEVAQRIQGSPDLYHGRGTGASVNFITCHDGFSLMDLYSYNHKHNEANGEDNRDGANDNNSWNCGHEGPTDDPGINRLRHTLIKNAVAMLMVSQGVPMINMGDEIGHTKFGNNNTYCHDNVLNWLDWSMREQNADLFRFFQQMIAFRHAHPALRSREHFQHRDHVNSGYPDISWHTTQAWAPDWGTHVRTLAFMLCGKHALDGTAPDDYIYVGMNMHWSSHNFQLPNLPRGMRWHLFADTHQSSPNDICAPGEERPLRDQRLIPLEARSLVIAVGR